MTTKNKRLAPSPSTNPLKQSQSSQQQPKETLYIPSPLEYPSNDIEQIFDQYKTWPTGQQSLFCKQLLLFSTPGTITNITSMTLELLKRDFISDLPIELVLQILKFLTIKSLGRCLLVSKNWKRILDGQGVELGIWKQHLLQEKWFHEDELNSIAGDSPHKYRLLFSHHFQIRHNW